MGKLIRLITQEGSLMATAVDSTDMVASAETFHHTSAVVTAALGRLLTAASMMGNQLKDSDSSLTVRIAGEGPIGSLVAVSDAAGNVRGYVSNPIVELPLKENGKLDVGKAVGAGTLTVIKDLGLKEPYVGTIPLTSGEIAEDITAYFAVSEQIPTACALGVLVNPDLTVQKAGGYLIQLLPGAQESCITRLEENLKKMKPVTTLMSEGMDISQIILEALSGFEVQTVYEQTASYRCPCSRERTESVLRSMGSEELRKMAEEMPVIRVKCHFCNREYTFSPAEVSRLADSLDGKEIRKSEK